MFRKITIFAVLIALVVSALPTVGVYAKGTGNLEKKWGQLITNFNKQNQNHLSAHKIIENGLKTHKNTSASDKADIERHLAICNSALSSASAIVYRHAGFDASGDVIDRGMAVKSIKDLTFYLQQHAGSVRNLKTHVKQALSPKIKTTETHCSSLCRFY